MRCDECLPLLDQYVEDELDEVTANSLTAHITACKECADAHAALRREQEVYANYLLEVEPSRHLWANLQLELKRERAISPSRTGLRLQHWLAVVLGDLRVTPQLATALVLITIGLVIGLLVWRTTIDAGKRQVQNSGIGIQPSSAGNRAGTDRDRGNTGHRGSADYDGRILPSSPKGGNRGRELKISATRRTGGRTIVRSPAVPTVDQVTRSAEQQYLSAIWILSRDIKRRRPGISPGLLAQLETALTEVDRNIAATRRVVREQPGDPFAVQYLALAYEKKIELLREVTSW